MALTGFLRNTRKEKYDRAFVDLFCASFDCYFNYNIMKDLEGYNISNKGKADSPLQVDKEQLLEYVNAILKNESKPMFVGVDLAANLKGNKANMSIIDESIEPPKTTDIEWHTLDGLVAIQEVEVISLNDAGKWDEMIRPMKGYSIKGDWSKTPNITRKYKRIYSESNNLDYTLFSKIIMQEIQQ